MIHHLSLDAITDDLDGFALKRPRGRHENDEKKGNHFGQLKAPRTPVSVGEEYIVTIEEMGKEGVGVAKLRGVSILIHNTNLGDKVMARITKVDGPTQWLKSLAVNRIRKGCRIKSVNKITLFCF